LKADFRGLRQANASTAEQLALEHAMVKHSLQRLIRAQINQPCRWRMN
jgi:hypothetical protein